jgi:hypothetical protein
MNAALCTVPTTLLETHSINQESVSELSYTKARSSQTRGRNKPGRIHATKSAKIRPSTTVAARGSAFTIYQPLQYTRHPTRYSPIASDDSSETPTKQHTPPMNRWIRHYIVPTSFISLRSYPIQAIWNEQNWQHYTEIPISQNHR